MSSPVPAALLVAMPYAVSLRVPRDTATFEEAFGYRALIAETAEGRLAAQRTRS